MQRRDGLQFGRYAWSKWTCCLLLSLFLLITSSAKAQSIWGEAGTSTMLRASGFQVNYNWAPVQGWFGAGWQDGFTVGGFLETRVRQYDVGIGDRYQPMVVDTDVFDQSRYFAGRGVFVERRDESRTLSAFGGWTAGEHSNAFYRSFNAEEPTGGFFLEQQFGSHFSVHSVNLIQDHITSIQSFRYKPSDSFNLSASGGVGQGGGFLSFATQLQQRVWQLTASYTDMGDTFQRVSGVLTNAPERVGLNVRFHYQPKRKLQFLLGHENMMSPTLILNGLLQKVSLDSANVATSIEGFRLGGGFSTSTSGNLHSQTASASVSRTITSSVTASSSVLHIDDQYQKTNILMANVTERFGPRLRLNQGITSQANNHTFTWGVNWISNRLTVGLQQDMLYTPLAGGFDGKPYTSMWAVNLIAPLPRAMRLHLDSIVDPAGKVRYTAWIDGIGWSKNGTPMPHQGGFAASSFSKFVVTGVVQDTDGKPVFGIAVQVDGQTAFTDTTGHFFMRFGKGLTYPLAVLTDRSLSPQYYQVVEAPVSATAETEDMAHQIVITVKRATPPVKRRSDVTDPGTADSVAPAAGK